jgi:hypothetical protein
VSSSAHKADGVTARSPAADAALSGWDLTTADTRLRLEIRDERPTIGLTNPSLAWDWTPTRTPVLLLARIHVGETAQGLDWRYEGAAVDTSDGTKVTLTFVNAAPALTMTQVWWARPGGGPVEQTTAIRNDTDGEVAYHHPDVVAADLTVTSDAETTLWRFNRSSYGRSEKPDPHFDEGVLTTPFGIGTTVETTIGNEFRPGDYQLPFVMLDVGGRHGLYLGYTWDFGRIVNTTVTDPNVIRTRFYLGDSGTVSNGPGKIFNVPGMFFGTYSGDTDAGSNAMKRWFYDHRMTATIKSTPNEPLVEYHVNFYSEAEIEAFLAANPLAASGVELLKLDNRWSVDGDETAPSPPHDPYFGWSWDPDPAKWPKGMTLGPTAHAHGLCLSLYLANRFRHADLATQEGRDAEFEALLTRFDDWQFDYWRTDMELEETDDYLSHEGFLEVLDRMIASRPGFRWENCSAGGSKKSFDLLQRQSNQNTEDSGASVPDSVDRFRKAYYANSYMINPVQLGAANAYLSPDTPAWARYMFRSSFFGAWLYGSNGTEMNTFRLADYEQHVAMYKARQRPILRGADVYHILPMPDGVNWDGLQFYNPDRNEGSVLLFKPNSAVGESPTVFLKGLDPAGRYRLTFQDRSELDGAFVDVSGSLLMASGTGIAIDGTPGDYDSEIIWIARTG